MSARMEDGRAHALATYMRAQALNATPGRADYLANVADDWERARASELAEKARAYAATEEVRRLEGVVVERATEIHRQKKRADAAEAEAAAMRRALEDALEWGRQYATDLGMPGHGPEWFRQASTALSSDAGKRLLETMERREGLLREAMAVSCYLPFDLWNRLRKEFEP